MCGWVVGGWISTHVWVGGGWVDKYTCGWVVGGWISTHVWVGGGWVDKYTCVGGWWVSTVNLQCFVSWLSTSEF